MSLNSVYDVLYEFGHKEIRRDLVLAASPDPGTIAAVLTSNGRTHPSGTVKILAVRNANVSQGQILS